MEQKQLQKILQSGNNDKIERAFSSLYEEYKGLLIFILSHYLSRKEDIEDCYNETFLDFFRHASSIHSNLKSYLTTSAKNKALDLLRKRKKEQFIEQEEDIKEEEHFSALIEFEAWAKTLIDKEDYQIILLHLKDGFSFEEIGAKYKENSSSIKTRYYRALKKLNKGE